MASVCGASLALMDAGVPLKRPTAGIAMGLILEGERFSAVVGDILGDEDHLGDIDFKVGRHRQGITSLHRTSSPPASPKKIMKVAARIQARTVASTSWVDSKALDHARAGQRTRARIRPSVRRHRSVK